MILLWSALSVHEKFVLGYAKDCTPYIHEGMDEQDFPYVCQDFGKYHLMLLGVTILMAMAFMIGMRLIVDSK